MPWQPSSTALRRGNQQRREAWQGRHIEIDLAEHGEHGIRTISSDGSIPHTDQQTRGDGTGLYIMKYRADIIGGTVEVRAAEPSGTKVVCIFPKG